jgi:hypothetical protein
MKHVARLCCTSGQTLLPCRTPYDHEQLFEHLLHRVRRAGTVAFEVGAHTWCVTLTDRSDGHACSPCGSPLHGLAFRAGDELSCLPCVRASLGAGWTRLASLMGFTQPKQRSRESA